MAIAKFQKTLSRLSVIIKDLRSQSEVLDKDIRLKRFIQKQNTPWLFSNNLFSSKSVSLVVYVNEVSQRLNELNKHATLNNTQITTSLIVLLEQQISALITTIHKIEDYIERPIKIRKTDPQYSLYQKLSEYHGFEKRLLNMIMEREEVNSTISIPNKEQIAIRQEIRTLHQRLSRCRQAIEETELSIKIIKT